MLIVSVIIPAYNESATIISLLQAVRRQEVDGVKFEVIVVDDGSSDNTWALIESHPELYDRAIRQQQNQGKGAAVLAGLRSATGQYILFQDADLEYSPDYYGSLLHPVMAFGADIVMGSRFMAAQYVRVQFFWHKVGNNCITMLFNMLFNTTFTDIYTCYLLYKRELVDPASLRSKGWEQHAEILCHAVRKAKVIYEVPISYHGRSYEEGKKIRAVDALPVIESSSTGGFLVEPIARFMPIASIERSGQASVLGHGYAIPLVIVLIALIVRIAAALVLPDQSASLPDATAFRDAAANLLRTGLLNDPVRMPLYPLLIAVTGGGRALLGADILIAGCSVLLVYALTLEIFRDLWGAALAGLMAALYPPFIFFSVVGLSETLFLTLVLGAFYGWYRGQFTGAAIAAVLAILTRPAFDLAALFFILYFSLVIHRCSLRMAARHLVFYGCIYVVLMTPWWIHNYRSYGTFVRFNLAFGTVLYAGNNPLNTSGGGNIGEDYDTSQFDSIKDPVARDRALRDAAVAYMAENPRRVVDLAVLKFLRIWRLLPYNAAYSNPFYSIALFGSFAPVCLLALAYLFMAWRRDWLLISPLLLFIGYYTGIHMLLLGTIRFRLPFEPYLVMFAAMGAVGLLRLWAPGLMGARGKSA